MVQVLCCWLVAGTSGQRYQQQQRQEPVAPAGKAQQQQPPYYRDALPKSAPAIPRYYPPAPVHYVSIGERLDGEYRFGYDSGNGPAGQSYRQEFRLPDGSIRGSYGYVDSRGHMRKVHYSAGQRGFVILKDERILDKEPPKEGLLMTTDSLHATTPLPPKVDDVPAQELLPRAPQFQEESRQVETQQSPQAAAVAPVPLPSKSAQEIQAEYYRSQLYAAPTVNRQQYAEPDAAAATPLPSEESPQQPLPKPKLSRPRPHRRRYGEYRHRQVYAQPPVVNRMLLSYNIGTGYY
ncbi:hypothetical protein V5799_031394 [Amblyomma americanum]|uniref:Uncharacterized protein n=1 Tax=Amblyomma americanum TaxID=6943 RepID=A0AAQ4EKK2_AMBAM